MFQRPVDVLPRTRIVHQHHAGDGEPAKDIQGNEAIVVSHNSSTDFADYTDRKLGRLFSPKRDQSPRSKTKVLSPLCAICVICGLLSLHCGRVITGTLMPMPNSSGFGSTKVASYLRNASSIARLLLSQIAII